MPETRVVNRTESGAGPESGLAENAPVLGIGTGVGWESGIEHLYEVVQP